MNQDQQLSRKLGSFVSRIAGLRTVDELLELTCKELGESWGLDRVNVHYQTTSQAKSAEWVSATLPRGTGEALEGLRSDGSKLWIKHSELAAPLFVQDIQRSRQAPELVSQLLRSHTKSFAILPLHRDHSLCGWIELYTVSRYLRWRNESVSTLSECAAILESFLKQAITLSSMVHNESRLRRLVERSPALMLECDASGTITYINARLAALLGGESSTYCGRELASVLTEVLTDAARPALLRSIQALIEGQITSSTHSVELVNRVDRTSRLAAISIERFERSGATPLLLLSATLTELERRHPERQRLMEYSRTLLLRTDREFNATHVQGDSQTLIGLTHNDLLSGGSAIWRSLILREDFRRVLRHCLKVLASPCEFSEEFRIIDRQTGVQRWIIARVIPLFGSGGELLGWEALALDNSERRQAQELLIQQGRAIEGLYEVSRAIQFHSDPSIVMLKGLRALIRATSSDCGMGFLYDRQRDKLELTAAEGVSPDYISGIEGQIDKERLLVRHVIDSREGIMITDIGSDPRAQFALAAREGLKASIVVPVMAEENVLGSLVLFRRSSKPYSSADFDLMIAAANQIGLAARQAELYAAIKKQASALAALYRLSHELSRYLTTNEVCDQAFSILHEELACKRMWLGLINEQGTHLVGQAGYGPGVRQPLIELQIERRKRHDFLDQALERREPVVVPADVSPECSGLNLVIKKLELGAFVIVPLVSLGQVVGTLVIEPTVAHGFFSEDRLSLLSSMGNEIGTVLLARRLESQISEAEKMRMAGLFASGVAHNFNNLLQAVMGQASLIQMQCSGQPQLERSTDVILEAANRGAALVKQLSSFAAAGPGIREVFSLQELIENTVELYRGVLGSKIELRTDINPDLPRIDGDKTKIQQVVTNLLVNAREAIGDRPGTVLMSGSVTYLQSNEIDPLLSPGDYVRLDVKDTGTGMNEEQRRRCFEPFYTTKDIDELSGVGVSGAGLGLSAAYSIVHQHGGHLVVDSAPGEGSTFGIYLPVHQERNSGVKDASAKPLVVVSKEDNVEPLSSTAGSSKVIPLSANTRVGNSG